MAINPDNINDELGTIFKSKTLLTILLEIEGMLDKLDMYAFENWIEGEVIDGPNVSKYWIDLTLMYKQEMMPDPEAVNRLLEHNIKVGFKKDKLEVPKKIEGPEDLETKTEETGADPGTPGYQKRRAKTETIPIWLVKLEIPRQFIDEYYSEQIYVDGMEVDIDDKVEMDIQDDQAEEMTDEQQQEMMNEPQTA